MTAPHRIAVLVFAAVVQAALSVVVTPRATLAHDALGETFVTTFIKIEAREAHFVTRVPLKALETVGFPAAGRELDLVKADRAVRGVVAELQRSITIAENGHSLIPSSAVGRLSSPSDRAFEQYQSAIDHVARPLTAGMQIYSGQGFLDAHITYPIGSPTSRFTIRTTFARELNNYLKLAVRYVPLGGEPRTMVITTRSGTVRLNPTWYGAAASFVLLGTAYILTDVEYLMFLLCLVAPFREVRRVVPIVAASMVAHSMILLGSGYDTTPLGLWFRLFVQTAIAAAVVSMALIDIVSRDGRRRWLAGGVLGVVYGFQFSSGLKEHLPFSGEHPLISLLSFNVGVEIGQLLVLAAIISVLAILFRYAFVSRVGMIVVLAVVAHQGWHWMMERGELLARAPWPTFDASALATFARWLAAVLMALGLGSLVVRRLRDRQGLSLPLASFRPWIRQSIGGGE